MKEYIEYYYNLIVDSISHKSTLYYFNSHEIDYVLCEGDRFDYNFYRLLQTNNYYGGKYKLITNSKNEIFSVINEKKYILFSIKEEVDNRNISIDDISDDKYIYNCSGFAETVLRFPWTTLWEQKIDYFENWLDSKIEHYKRYYAMFNYYIGFSENALLYLKQIVNKSDSFMTIQHNLVSLDDDLYSFLNPLNLVVDHGCRDITEYFKQKLLKNELTISDVSSFLKRGNYSKEWITFFYSRMLYPTFFYDIFENTIITGDDSRLEKLEDIILIHYNFMNELSIYFEKTYSIPVIKWLKKVDNYCLLE